MISPARVSCATPPTSQATPTARFPSKMTRFAWACVRDVEIGAAAHRVEERASGAAPASVVHRVLVVPHAFLIAAVVVGVARVAARDRRLDEGVGHLVRLVLVGDDERRAAGGAGVPDLRGGGPLEVLGLAEVREDGLVRPASVAELGPDVVVKRLASHVEHAVDRARSPESPAARDGDPPPVDVVLGLGLEAPVVAAIVHQLGEADRDRDPGACVLAARLQQQDALGGVLGESIGEHASGRAGTDDDVVVVSHGCSCPLPSRPPACVRYAATKYA